MKTMSNALNGFKIFFLNKSCEIVLEKLSKIKTFLVNDCFLSISLFAAIVTSFFNTPNWGYVDFKVIVCLLELMIIVKAFEEYSLINHLSLLILNRCKNERILLQVLCLFAFISSMFLTNDVALMAVTPLLINISRKSGYNIILPTILITISANLGSCATPIGNPQNLYIFSHYQLLIGNFFSYSLPICIVSLFLLLCITFFFSPKQISFSMKDASVLEKKKIIVFSVLFVLLILNILGTIPYYITLPILILVTLILNKSLLKKLDYGLLITFVCFFISVGNISNIATIRNFLTLLTNTSTNIYLSSLLLSQIISNVPSSILLAPFSFNWHALFYGVTIGGLGTPIASLASIISYKILILEYPNKKKEYLSKFLLLNFFCLLIIGLIFYIYIQLN
ncbi:SLC13 family permease [Clostridium saccharoperbutylacetonicum]|uniref:SLC13 family permease n=1 Tax=Clostridium saccharoperbutylacetonicum TaxID=36745 RepID=UPI0039EA0AF7